MPELTRAEKKYRQRRDNLTQVGKCLMCATRQALPTHTRCKECAAWHALYTIQRKHKFAKAGLCYTCGRSEFEFVGGRNDSRKLCVRCYLRNKAAKILGSARYWSVIYDKLIAQQHCCAYTGSILQLGVNDSVDHILPSSRFPESKHDPNNIEWVTRQVNDMKHASTPEEFIALIESILRYRQQIPAMLFKGRANDEACMREMQSRNAASQE